MPSGPLLLNCLLLPSVSIIQNSTNKRQNSRVLQKNKKNRWWYRYRINKRENWFIDGFSFPNEYTNTIIDFILQMVKTWANFLNFLPFIESNQNSSLNQEDFENQLWGILINFSVKVTHRALKAWLCNCIDNN